MKERIYLLLSNSKDNIKIKFSSKKKHFKKTKFVKNVVNLNIIVNIALQKSNLIYSTKLEFKFLKLCYNYIKHLYTRCLNKHGKSIQLVF